MIFSSTVARAGGELRSFRVGASRGNDGRLFGNLPDWQPAQKGADVAEVLWDLSEALYIDGAKLQPNKSIPAAYTYFGQLINHDLTFNATASLEAPAGSATLRNLRTPRFDLDCLYGRGPLDQPYLYDGAGSGRLVLGANGRGELDLLRSPVATSAKSTVSENPFNLRRPAIIGDPRNDENIILSQLHLAVLRFHNGQIDAGKDFEAARRATRWHYQWVAIHDFLERLCGPGVVAQTLGVCGRPDLRVFDPRAHAAVPVEFSLAAYRFGHSMIRHEYGLSAALLAARGGPLPIFGELAVDSLVGGRALPPQWTIQWSFFVEHPQSPAEVQFSKTLGPQISRPLRSLPMPGEKTRFRSLAFRTLLRGWQMGLPSGQDVARRLAEPVIAGNDPLWIYVLREAAEPAPIGGGGHRLGRIGARLVAEVFIGLLAADPDSYLAIDPNWTPAAGAAFGLTDFLAQAGAPMTQADWKTRPGA